ncbi:MAG: hypothetical protein GXP18_03355 [Gammaproteobacteria bacterium]|nr:hypothetical protein [Gammaproteobacteria bacterium]
MTVPDPKMRFRLAAPSAHIITHINSVLWISLALGSLHALITLYQGTLALAYPFATTRIESFILNGATRFAQGEPIYLGLANSQYILHVYNPLSYLPVGIAGRLFNLNMENMLLTGRLLSYFSTLLLASVLAIWVRHKSGGWRYGLFVGLGIFFFQQFAATDFFRFRPEPVALLLTFLGVLVYQSDIRNKIIITSLLLFSAFLFKQPFIAAPVAVLIHLLIEKNHKSAALFCASMSGLLALYFGIAYIATDGLFFQNTFVAMASNQISVIKNFKIYMPIYFERSYALILALPVAILALLHLWPKYRFLLIYLFISATWTFITAGKNGAGDNYFSELSILLLLCIALTLAEYKTKQPLIVSALLILLSSQVITDQVREGIFTPTVKIRFENGGASIAPYVKRYCGSVENTLILHEKLAVHCGNPAGLDWYLMDLLASKGQIDLSPLFSKITQGEFQRVIFDQQPRSQVAVKIFGLVKNGPYQRAWSDKVISEWVLTPPRGGQP